MKQKPSGVAKFIAAVIAAFLEVQITMIAFGVVHAHYPRVPAIGWISTIWLMIAIRGLIYPALGVPVRRLKEWE